MTSKFSPGGFMPQHDLEKRKDWEEKLENYRNSRLTQMQWCQKNNEKIHTFKYWHNKLKKGEAFPIEFEELKDSSSFAIEIHKKEISICLPHGFDQKTLKDCLAALQKNSC
jgi:hypothetical protein